MRLKYTAIVFIFASALFITSCLTGTEQEDVPSRYAVDFRLEDVQLAHTTEEDTLEINEVTFLQGQIALQSATGDSIVLFSGPGVYNYQFPAAELSRLIIGDLEEGTYESLAYAIEKAETGNDQVPEQFIDGEGEEQRYSMIITGQYNQADFEFKSTEPYSFEFSLGSPVDIPENNVTLTLGVNFDIHQVFLTADSTVLLDPSDPNNAEQINDNIESAIGLIPFN